MKRQTERETVREKMKTGGDTEGQRGTEWINRETQEQKDKG
jgi:hypothetical protein